MPIPTHPRPLQPRLLDFGVAVCHWARYLPRDATGTHLHRQIVRSALSAGANYAEARGAESRSDFVHKMQLALKELRETAVWLNTAKRLRYPDRNTGDLLRECDELIAIFVASVNTVKRRLHGS